MVYPQWKQKCLPVGYPRESVRIQSSDVFRRHGFDGHAKHFPANCPSMHPCARARVSGSVAVCSISVNGTPHSGMKNKYLRVK